VCLPPLSDSELMVFEMGMEEGRVPQHGAIANCASVNSIMSLQGTVPYTISKHGVVGVTKAAVLEARPRYSNNRHLL
jgi:NAD(P)-dependent dehydrogenase (short-subunit alcohol dehydrogenase family)